MHAIDLFRIGPEDWSEFREVRLASLRDSQSEAAVELISMWAPGERGTGLAGRLAERVVTWAEAIGRRTYLMVREDNIGAIRAYARAGLVDHGVPEDWPDHALQERWMWHDGTNTSG